MKKIILFFILILTVFLSSCGGSNQITKDGLVYDVNGKTCSLVGYNATNKDNVIIPRKVDNYLVTSIGSTKGGVFKGHSEITIITIPDSIHYIGDEVFSGTGIENIYIPKNVTYIGNDCFKDCKSLNVIRCESKGAFMNLGWSKTFNPDNRKVEWNASMKGDAIVELAKAIATGFVSGCASKVGQIAINNILSAFGYQDPEAVFRDETTQSLDEIKKAIIDGNTKILSQVQQVSDKVTELRDFVTSMEREIFAKIDRTEFDSRMTVIGRDIATLDTLYDKYQRAVGETNFDVAKATTTQLIDEIEKADLQTIINFLKGEFSTSAAGSQTPIITLYFTYLKNVYPFMHQVAPRLESYAEYCRMELLKAGELYTEYCNYKQAVNNDDETQKTLWQNNSEAAKKNLLDALDGITALLPEGDFDLTKDNKSYHLVNLDKNINFWFSTDLLPVNQVVFREDDQDNPEAPNYYYAADWKVGTVEQDEYRRLDQLRVAFNKDLTLLDFINLHAGTSITTNIWGCKSVPFYDGRWDCCPTIDLRNVNDDREFDCTNGDPIVHTWK